MNEIQQKKIIERKKRDDRIMLSFFDNRANTYRSFSIPRKKHTKNMNTKK